MTESGWMIRESVLEHDLEDVYGIYPSLFTLCLHHGGRLTLPPNCVYVGGKTSYVDLVDIDKFSVHEVDDMVEDLGYTGRIPMYYQFLNPKKQLDDGLEDLGSDEDCLNLAKHVGEFKMIHVYISHGMNNIKNLFTSLSKLNKGLTIEEIDEPGPYSIVPSKLNMDKLDVGQSYSVPKKHDSQNVDGERVDGQNVDGERVHGQNVDGEKVDGEKNDDVFSSGLDIDINDYLDLDDMGVEGQCFEGQDVEGHSLEIDNDNATSETSSGSDEDQSRTEKVISDRSSSSSLEADNTKGGDDEDTSSGSDEDSEFIVDSDNNMTDLDVEMSDYDMNVDSDLEDEGDYAERVDYEDDVIDNDKFLSGSESDDMETGARKSVMHRIIRENENQANFYLGQCFGTKQEAKKLIRKHAVETRRLIKIKTDDQTRVRAYCFGSQPDFQVDDCGVHVDSQPNKKGPSGSNIKAKGGISTRGKVKGSVGKRADIKASGSGKRTKEGQNKCPWVILVSRQRESETWVVRTLNTNHNCIQSRQIYACTSTFLAEQMVKQIEENPNIPVKAVQDQFRRKYGVGVHKMKAYRAKMKAKRKMQGDHSQQYSLLRDYADELLSKNPGSTVKIEVEIPPNPQLRARQFKRIYVCLGALKQVCKAIYLCLGVLKQGFKALKRDLLGLDGAFMKGTFPGQMLTAVGLDGNNCIYPVAYAIVESENLSSWTWFLELLADDLDIRENSRFTWMSDRQKGLLPAIEKIFPCSEHRYCLRHIHENMKLAGYRGVLYKNMLYKCATATTKPEFLKAMDELKAFNKEAHLWLSKIPPEHWSRSYYSGWAISDVMINNMYEVYNGKIVEGRDRPIISALEYVREYLMRRIVTVLGTIDKSTGLLTPRAATLFESIKKQANHYTVQWNGGDLYEVSGKPTDPRVVNLAERSCSCRGWLITGMPCRHAVAALWVMAANGGRVGALESWVHPIHTMERWKEVYAFKINPINGRSLWISSPHDTTIVAPKHHTPAGRPKKARKRSVVERDDVPQTGKLSRKNMKGQCGRCGLTGHNIRTCTGPLKKSKNVAS